MSHRFARFMFRFQISCPSALGQRWSLKPALAVLQCEQEMLLWKTVCGSGASLPVPSHNRPCSPVDFSGTFWPCWHQLPPLSPGTESPDIHSYSWCKEVSSFAYFQLMYSFHWVVLTIAVWDQGKKSPQVWWRCTKGVCSTWSPLIPVSDNLSVSFPVLAEHMYKPDMYRRTCGFTELHLGMQRNHLSHNIPASKFQSFLLSPGRLRFSLRWLNLENKKKSETNSNCYYFCEAWTFISRSCLPFSKYDGLKVIPLGNHKGWKI